ncbi:MAG: acetate--CoA ligase family protein [Bacteroidales bacterium]
MRVKLTGPTQGSAPTDVGADLRVRPSQIDWAPIDQLFERARAAGRNVLLETEGSDLLEALGFTLPRRVFIPSDALANGRDPSALDPEGTSVLNPVGTSALNPVGQGFSLGKFNLPGDRVVVKVISPEILHKSDVGGVKIVANTPTAIAQTIADMDSSFAGQQVAGYMVGEFIPYDRGLGHELLLGLRWTEDFGAVVTFGPGGIYTEFLSANFRPGRNVAIFSPEIEDDGGIEQTIDRVAVMNLVTGKLRGQPAKIQARAVVPAVSRFMALARRYMPGTISECEINPLVVTDHGLVALDILVKLTDVRTSGRPDVRTSPRPVHKLKNLLEPRSAAIIGVSEKLNPGHIILNNLIREGFERSRIAVIKPGSETLEGCRCYPDVQSLPERVDLFVLAVSAAQAPDVVADVIEQQKAESLIVSPGGLEEKKGTEHLTSRMRQALALARESEWQGPLINGGNCLGIRSLPGHYDTMFIPEHKLPVPGGPVSPIAFISQSGAFAISRMSKLPLNPKYAITCGNQMDVTIGDYLAYLKDDPEIAVFAVYVEGFATLDGRQFLNAAADIAASGRTVILYRAGRTAAGAQASASHTASIAGDYAVTRALAQSAGVVVAESLRDYEDLIKLFTWLGGKAVGGWRLGAISNAGFECVAIADNLGSFVLPTFDEWTSGRLEATFKQARIDSVVDVHNPLDLTPMAGDAPYEDAVRAVIDASNIDAAIVGCVPLTPAMNTLPAGRAHTEDQSREDSFVNRMIRLKAASIKPWVAVVDAGKVYDPLVAMLEANQVPVFREADRALRLFNLYCAARMKNGARV